MKTQLVVMTLAVLLFADVIFALPFTEPEEDTTGDEYKEDYDRYLENPIKRSCVRRGDRCDHRPDDCCNNSSCRCNLFGASCMCERMGLFQQWGK